MKFETWNKLYEASSAGKIEDVANSVAEQMEKELKRKFFVIPEIDKFTRPDEPVQVGYLISDEKAQSMRLNFTEEGELYSVDYWKSDDSKPSITVYLNDLSVENAIGKLIAYYKNPSAKAIQEAEEELTVEKPAQAKEADKKVIAAEEKSEYEFQNPRQIFSDLELYVDMVIDGELYALLLTGQAGVGKTFLVTKKLEDRGLKRNVDWFKITGKTTAAGMYIDLYEHNGKLLLFDDCDSIFKDDNAVNVLKGALDTSKVREIAWKSAVPLKSEDKKQIPKSFDFTGKVIFLSNLPKKKIDPAIRSRSFTLEIALSKKDMITRMWTLLGSVNLPSGIKVKLPLRERAMNMIVKAAEESNNVELNMRTLIKAISIANRVPTNDDLAMRLIKQQCTGVN